MFEGFERHDIDTEDARIASFIGGSGPPLLLLHGYPQTHEAWHRLAPMLAQRYTVVATDSGAMGTAGVHSRSTLRPIPSGPWPAISSSS